MTEEAPVEEVEALPPEPLYRSAARIGTQSALAGVLAGVAGTLAVFAVDDQFTFRPELVLILGLAYLGASALLSLAEEAGQRWSLSGWAYLGLLVAAGSIGFLVVLGCVGWGMHVVVEQRSPLEATQELVALAWELLTREQSDAGGLIVATGSAMVVTGWIREASQRVEVRALAGVASGLVLALALSATGQLTLSEDGELVFVLVVTTTAASLGLVLGERLEGGLHAKYQARLDRD